MVAITHPSSPRFYPLNSLYRADDAALIAAPKEAQTYMLCGGAVGGGGGGDINLKRFI